MTTVATSSPVSGARRQAAEGTLGGAPLGPAERAARGKAARARAPRRTHAEYEPAPNRADPIDVIDRQSRSRLPELVPLRYQRMTESPFRFYRGAAAIMAADLAGTPTSGIDVQLCGDAHLLNFRLLGSPERRLVFDINDFDETLPGPWEWDVKRFATSLAIAARANGFGPSQRREIVATAVSAYRTWMHRFATMTNLDVWYAHVDVDEVASRLADVLGGRGSRRLSRATSRARSRDRLRAFTKLTEVVGGERRFASDPPLLIPIDELHTGRERELLMGWLGSIVGRYSDTLSTDRRWLLAQYRLVDFARKVVGVGSVGTRCWVALLLGRDDGDPLLLQIKEAGTSVLADHLPGSEYGNQGERVVAGQRLIQASSDIFLGWQRVEGLDGQRRDFYVRQLQDWKGIADTERMNADDLTLFGRLCAATLARAHARSGDRIAIAAYLGASATFDQAVARFAEAYADQNEADHAALVEAVRTGRVSANEP
ncbi:DUF2252 domain-containing protein [Frankia sp. CNm7]|uniref:DUF2252 domain-containing protein n=1 Tax=Frankia nepalensis TaxID=1836974 RepID=A0A937UQ28_9ACTN|nr:DUF2252 domain-containing protein [Frankia nepalensis]MBL7497973.1 DUF2252 domain-containing protein [Frankia nepalensis]MBL7509054.1 DUF2252 domain-containing protein [Frankia nepalensis]MBL7516843.1 DUF2252 domain-containing protein [Frankia nepalensis]MBL7627840.1 DUF2252 domain-containing protein [Frankia nepalensis]